jgi:CheY-like chemotaxis protein
VLFVEDNALVREIICELLAESGRDVMAVSSGEDAAQAYRDYTFDLVVTDVSLPGMSGLDLVRELKRLNPDVPVILASGYPLQFEQGRFGSKVRTITKPFDSEQLEALIGELNSDDSAVVT